MIEIMNSHTCRFSSYKTRLSAMPLVWFGRFLCNIHDIATELFRIGNDLQFGMAVRQVLSPPVLEIKD